MSEYTINYRVRGRAEMYVGSGRGNTPEEALQDFMKWATEEDIEEIVSIEFYKEVHSHV